MIILQICSKMPFPILDGGCRAMAELYQGLSESGNQVHLLALKTHKHPGHSHTAEQPSVIAIEADTKIRLMPLLKNFFFRKGSYNLERFSAASIKEALVPHLRKLKPDLVILDGFFTSPLLETIRKNTEAKLIYRPHNVEWKLWKDRADHSKNPLLSLYFKTMSQRLKKEELAFAKTVDGFLFISEEDEEFFHRAAGHSNGIILPFTMPDSATLEKAEHTETVFYHLGAMDWFPNVEGMKWFIETVWPEFHRMEPASKMIIAGKSMPESWFHLNLPGLEVLGEVREPEQVLQRADVLVAPVFSASGVRIKILEALSRGKPVLTHRAGIQGLIVKQLGGVIIANERDEYLRAMFELHRNRDYRRQLSQDALRYTGQFHSRTRVFSRVNQYLRQITGQA